MKNCASCCPATARLKMCTKSRIFLIRSDCCSFSFAACPIYFLPLLIPHILIPCPCSMFLFQSHYPSISPQGYQRGYRRFIVLFADAASAQAARVLHNTRSPISQHTLLLYPSTGVHTIPEADIEGNVGDTFKTVKRSHAGYLPPPTVVEAEGMSINHDQASN